MATNILNMLVVIMHWVLYFLALAASSVAAMTILFEYGALTV